MMTSDHHTMENLMDLDEIAQEITAIQREVADIYASSELHRIAKDNGKDFTTLEDQRAERQVIERFRARYPGIRILGEESGEHGGNGPLRAIIDPVDGTGISSNGGDYFSTLFGLTDTDAQRVLLGSGYQPRRGKQFLYIKDRPPMIVEEFLAPNGARNSVVRVPRPSTSPFFGEWLGCCIYPSKYGKQEPTKEHFERFKAATKRLFAEQEVEFPAGRKYRIIDAKPGSGSSGLFLCDIADGQRHFAVLMKQAVHDVVVGAPYAKAAGCIVEVLGEDCRPTGADLERVICSAGKKDAINIAVYANEHVKRGVEERLQL